MGFASLSCELVLALPVLVWYDEYSFVQSMQDVCCFQVLLGREVASHILRTVCRP